MTIHIQKKFGIFIVIFVIGFFLSPNGIDAISLSPTKQTLIIKPGKSELIKFDIINDSEITKIITPELEGFRVDEKTGRPIFGQRDAALSWITPVKNEITLKPGSKGTFSFTVAVPKDALASGHYIALFAKEKNIGGQIGVSARVGSLLFLYTEGMISENLYVVSFNPEKKLLKNNAVKLFLTLKNNGNIHLVPEGEIIIRNRSKKVISRINLNELNRKVLPNGTWTAEYSLNLPRAVSNVGLIYAETDITYGLTRQKMGATTTFWYLPIGTILYLFEFLLLGGLIFLIIKKYTKK